MTAEVSKKRIRIVVSLIIVAFIIGILFGDRGLMKLFSLHRQSLQVEETMSQLEIEKGELQKQITQLEKGGIYLERFAREQLGLVAADEIVYEFRTPPKLQKELQ